MWGFDLLHLGYLWEGISTHSRLVCPALHDWALTEHMLTFSLTQTDTQTHRDCFIGKDRYPQMALWLAWPCWYLMLLLLLVQQWTNQGGLPVVKGSDVTAAVTCTERSQYAYYFLKAIVHEVADSGQLETLLSQLPAGQPTIIKLAAGWVVCR